MYKNLTKWGLIAGFFSVPLITQGALVFQMDFNDTGGASTLDTTFPDTPPVTATQWTPGDPVLFDTDVPNANSGGFSGDFHKGSGSDENALNFNFGADQFNGSTAFTMAAWLKPAIGTVGQSRSFSHTGQLFHERLNATTSRLRFGAGVNMDGPLALPEDVWTFAAITYDGADATFYSRTEGAGSFTINIVDVTDGASVGASNNSIFLSHPGSVAAGWNGGMDNMRLYNHALTVGDLNTLYSFDDTVVPEPSHYAILLGLVTIGFVVIRKRRKN